jgi:hypothetical protein
MTPDELEQQLHSCIRFVLGQYAYKPPRTRDTSVTDRYYNSVADAIVRQIKLSGWELRAAQTLEKQPPRLPHSTAQFMRKDEA